MAEIGELLVCKQRDEDGGLKVIVVGLEIRIGPDEIIKAFYGLVLCLAW